MSTTPTTSVREKLRQVPEDRRLAPRTGWTRQHLAVLADELLLAVRPFAGADHSHILIPAADGRDVRPIDGLEGFARTFMLAAFRLSGERGADPLGLAEWYASGLAAGVDPANPGRWPRPDEHAQAKVEAAALAVGLHFSREWVWTLLTEQQQRNVIAYLASVIGTAGPHTNWVWFRLVVEQFLDTVGGPSDPDDVHADLRAHESFVRQDGWYADGDTRAFDHYNGWALQLYPFLWRQMGGGTQAAEAAYRARFDRFLADAARLVGADGAPLMQGRSLVYRFAAAAPFWTAALIGSDVLSPGQVRRAAMGVVRHFVDHGVPDARGILSLGWFGEWPALAQAYSGTGSPYWAAKGLLGLALPADHPVWSAVEEPLPGEQASAVAVIEAPGWLISSTVADGVVRVYNHGTDHALPGDEGSDEPLYARLAYSTATFPLLRAETGRLPDCAVVVRDGRGRISHRAGFERLAAVCDADGTAFGFSRWTSRWMDLYEGQPDFAHGLRGSNRYGPVLTVGSVVRDEWEVRLIRLDPHLGATDDVTSVAVTGWPVTGGQLSYLGDAAVVADGIRSSLRPVGGSPRTGVQTDVDATPLPGSAATPWLVFDAPERGRWQAVIVELSGAHPTPPPRVVLDTDLCTVTWSDGSMHRVRLPEASGATA
ncbi:DUF2264 domain-containing protein [Streptomyces sp. NPDC058739]|uniref:DUF2264 domain-containing protein n=1 Tax=Streptomyces sp. NPDC058739 TaxID=3346618 RepID=UPI00368AA426